MMHPEEELKQDTRAIFLILIGAAGTALPASSALVALAIHFLC